MTCDEVFTLFVKEMCKKVNLVFATILIQYVSLYRDVVNEFNSKYRLQSETIAESPDRGINQSESAT